MAAQLECTTDDAGEDDGEQPVPDQDGLVAEATTFDDLACGESVIDPASTPDPITDEVVLPRPIPTTAAGEPVVI